MDRKKELLDLIKNDSSLVPLIDEVVYLEEQLDYLRSLPKIKVHPQDPSKQKPTPAAKMYKEFLQQYINAIKVLLKATGVENENEESPLRRWMNERLNSKENNMDT
ncbi:hypothetical protein J6S88_01345 [bacterium]|nr:hypothetical protein [bacterium]